MDNEYLQLMISFTTLIIFIISVYFIYRQLQQVEKSIRGNTYQAMIDQASTINRIFVDNPELARLWGSVEYVGVKGKKNEVKMDWILTLMMDFYENMYFQHEQGNLPDEIWKRWEWHIVHTFKKSKRLNERWKKSRRAHYEKFVKFIDDRLEDEA